MIGPTSPEVLTVSRHFGNPEVTSIVIIYSLLKPPTIASYIFSPPISTQISFKLQPPLLQAPPNTFVQPESITNTQRRLRVIQSYFDGHRYRHLHRKVTNMSGRGRGRGGGPSKKLRRLSTDSEGTEDAYDWVGLKGSSQSQSQSQSQSRTGRAEKTSE